MVNGTTPRRLTSHETDPWKICITTPQPTAHLKGVKRVGVVGVGGFAAMSVGFSGWKGGGGGSSRVGHCVGLLDAGSSRSGGNLAVSPPQQIQPRPRKQACGGGAKKAADENRSEKNKVEEGHKKGRDEEDEGKKLYSSTHLSESATATGAVKWGFRRAPTQVWPVVVIKLDARRETGASHHFRIRSDILLPILSRGIKDGG